MSSEHGHHPAPLSDVEARTRALESLLLEKGLLTPDAVDQVITAYERDIGPLNGARVVARAWVDAEYKKRLLTDATPGTELPEIDGVRWMRPASLDEVEACTRPDDLRFTSDDVLARVEELGDLFAATLAGGQSLPRR